MLEIYNFHSFNFNKIIMKRLIFLLCILGILAPNGLSWAISQTNPLSLSAKLDGITEKYTTKLDSIVTYDNNGNAIKRINNYRFDTENRLLFCTEEKNDAKTRFGYEYDSCGNQVSSVILDYNEETEEWTVRFRETAAYYNGCDNPLLRSYSSEGVSEFGSQSSENENITYEYVNGKITKREKRDETGTPVIQETSYAYNSEGKITTILYKELENSVLTPSSKIKYTYFPVSENINHFKTETIYRYNENAPVKCMRTEYDPSKLASGNQFITTIEYFDATGEICTNKEVRTSYFTKDEENYTYMQKYEVGIYDVNENIPSATIRYDNEGNATVLRSGSSTEENSLWTGKWAYDPSAGIDTYSVYENNTEANLQWSMSVYYKTASTPTINPDIDFSEKNTFSVYPNPAENNLYVAHENISGTIRYSIYNLTGKLQLHGAISSKAEPIVVQSLPSGSYIISFFTEEQKGTSVFVKK